MSECETSIVLRSTDLHTAAARFLDLAGHDSTDADDETAYQYAFLAFDGKCFLVIDCRWCAEDEEFASSEPIESPDPMAFMQSRYEIVVTQNPSEPFTSVDDVVECFRKQLVV